MSAVARSKSVDAAAQVPHRGERSDQEAFPAGPSRYAGDQELGRGGWGVVIRASDRQLDRDVAVKKLGTHAVGNPEMVKRFMHEGLITAQLQHPGIVPVYERGMRGEDGQPFYAMKLLEGVTLQHKLRDYHCMQPGAAKRSQLNHLLACFVDICNAIAYAHQQQVIHRDLKPENVIVGQFGETVVVDWGLAKRMGSDPDEAPPHDNSMATLAAGTPMMPSAEEVAATDAHPAATRMGSIVGTPAYMSPEQARGATDEIGPHSDIYALGVILYEMLTGHTPFHSSDVQTTLANVIRGHYKPPQAIDRSVPPPLASICRHAMAARPEDRYATAQQMADDVSRYLAGDKVSVHNESTIERVGRACRQRPALVAASIAGALILAISASVTSVIVSRAHRAQRLAKEQAQAAHAEESVIRRQAEAEHRWADQHLQQVQEAADGLLNQWTAVLDYYPAARPLRQDLLRQAIDHYRSLYHHLSDQSGQQLESARCLLQIANLQALSGDRFSARQTYAIAAETVAAAAPADLSKPRWLRERSEIAIGLIQCGSPADASTITAIGDLQSLLVSLKNPLPHPQSDAATRGTLARGHLVIGRFQASQADHAAAIQSLRHALHHATTLGEQTSVAGLRLVSDIQIALAEAYRNSHQHHQASIGLLELIDNVTLALQMSPSRTDWLMTRAWAEIRWGQAQQDLGHPDAAAAALKRGLEDLVHAWQLPIEVQTESVPWQSLAADCLEYARQHGNRSNDHPVWDRSQPNAWTALLQELQPNRG